MQFLEEACDVEWPRSPKYSPEEKVRAIVYNVQDQLLINELTGSDPPAAGGDDGSGITVGCGSISHESYKALLIQLQQVRDGMHAKHQ